MWLPAAAPEPQHKDEQRSVIMRLEELIIYKDFSQGELLHHMVYLMEHYREKKDRALFYDCMHDLLELAFTAISGTVI